MKPEQFYRHQNLPEYDKFDKKVAKFTYYDMMEFASDYRFNEAKKYPFAENVKRYTLRVMGFPFFLIIAFIYSAIVFLQFVIGFVRFGGEVIAYTKRTNYKTISDVYGKLCESQELKK
jgi:hypothetical protein